MKNAQITRRFHAPSFAVTDTDTSGQDTLSFKVGGVDQGAIVQIWLHCHGSRLSQVRFRAYGSPTLIAFADALCEALEERSINSLHEFQLISLQQQVELANTEINGVMVFNEHLQAVQLGNASADDKAKV